MRGGSVDNHALTDLHSSVLVYLSYCAGALCRAHANDMDDKMAKLGEKLFPQILALLDIADNHPEEYVKRQQERCSKGSFPISSFPLS
jgi:hypothetical protein